MITFYHKINRNMFAQSDGSAYAVTGMIAGLTCAVELFHGEFSDGFVADMIEYRNDAMQGFWKLFGPKLEGLASKIIVDDTIPDVPPYEKLEFPEYE